MDLGSYVRVSLFLLKIPLYNIYFRMLLIIIESKKRYKLNVYND